MSRILFNIDEARNQALEELAQRENTTKIDLIKEALDLLFRERNYTVNDSLNTYFGIWSYENEDVVECQNELCKEWDK